MPYKKGNHKKGGRKPGSLNKNTIEAKAFVEYIVEHGYVDWNEIWEELKAKDRADVILKAMEFILPKHARVENQNKLPTSITVNLIPATQEKLQQQNTIDITHEEVDNAGGD